LPKAPSEFIGVLTFGALYVFTIIRFDIREVEYLVDAAVNARQRLTGTRRDG
jgi:hypothetical protein